MVLHSIIETNFSCFSRLESEWLSLLGRSTTRTVFQSPQFLQTWWETLGSGELAVVTMRDETGILRGIAPFFIRIDAEGRRELCWIGCVNVSDYLDAIVDSEHTDRVYAELRDVITSALKWDSIYLCSLPEQSPTRSSLKEWFPDAQELVQDVAPQITLPDTWETYLQQLERKNRHEIRRKNRKLTTLDHAFVCVIDPQQVRAATETFIALHRASSTEKKAFWNDEHLAFFRRLLPIMAEKNWLRLFFLEVEGEKVAAMLIFEFANHYNLYNSGFLPDKYPEVGTGAVLTAHTIEQAIKQQIAVYDFLRGGESYKMRYGAVPQNVYDISVSASSTGQTAR